MRTHTIPHTTNSTGVPITPKTLEPALYWLYQAAQEYNEFDVWHMQEANAVTTRRIGQFFEKYDLLLTPTNEPSCMPAGPGTRYSWSPLDNVKDEEGGLVYAEKMMDASRYMVIANSTGTPAITVPAGMGVRGFRYGFNCMHLGFARTNCSRWLRNLNKPNQNGSTKSYQSTSANSRILRITPAHSTHTFLTWPFAVP
jgi:hypothetical protein